MPGEITLKTGRHAVAPGIWFEIAQRDCGVVLRLCDERVNAQYKIQLDERGMRMGGSVRPFRGKAKADFAPQPLDESQWINSVEPARDLNALLREAVADPLRCFPAHARHRFTIRDGPKARDRHQAWPLAGYDCAAGTYVLYRLPNRLRGERLLKLLDDDRVQLNDDADPNRLPEDEWQRFLHLGPRKRFTLNHQSWQKMTVAEVAEAVAGRAFTCLPEES